MRTFFPTRYASPTSDMSQLEGSSDWAVPRHRSRHRGEWHPDSTAIQSALPTTSPWYNQQRLMHRLGRVPPAEAEAEAHYHSEHVTDRPAGTQKPEGA
jgi:hypothetical protein